MRHVPSWQRTFVAANQQRAFNALTGRFPGGFATKPLLHGKGASRVTPREALVGAGSPTSKERQKHRRDASLLVGSPWPERGPLRCKPARRSLSGATVMAHVPPAHGTLVSIGPTVALGFISCTQPVGGAKGNGAQSRRGLDTWCATPRGGKLHPRPHTGSHLLR